MEKIVTCAMLSILVLACSSSGTSDPNLDAWEREVRILEPGQLGDRQYDQLGGVLEEREPIRSAYEGENEAIDTAKRHLRHRAAELDADAVVIVECGHHVRPIEGTSLQDSTIPEVVCHGVAIRWLD